MRSYALLTSLATVVVAQISLAEQVTQGFAPACSNAACPHPVAAVCPQATQQVGPRLFAPALNSTINAPVPAPIRDHDVRLASNNVVSAKAENKSELLKEKVSEVARLQTEIQQLSAELDQSAQIQVKVQILEVSLTKLRKLGVDVSFTDDGQLGVMDPAKLTKAIELSSKWTGDKNRDTQSEEPVRACVDSLIANNIAKVLSEPNVVIVSGRRAQIFCGTEIPLPAGDGANSGVEYRKCGTKVDVTAVSLSDTVVHLDLRIHVSSCGDGQSIRIDDLFFPAIQVRQCDWTVETKFGQSIVLNGMVTKRAETATTDAEHSLVENEVAQILVITPELVKQSHNVSELIRAPQTK